MTTTIKLKGGTAAAWTSSNRTLEAREVGLETDTRRFKFGDGLTPWNSLPYAGEGAGRIVAIGDVELPGGGIGVTVNTSAVTANSRIFVSWKLDNAAFTASAAFEVVTNRVPGESFELSSESAGLLSWMIVEPNG